MPSMNDGNFQIGVVGGLLDHKHYMKMREAIWLFLWLVHRQTNPNGRVLARKFSGITYDEIGDETGWSPRTVRRWMKRLVTAGYVFVKYTIYSRLLVTVANPKKFAPKQLALPMSSRPDVAETAARCGRLKQTYSRTIIRESRVQTPHAIPRTEFEQRRIVAAQAKRIAQETVAQQEALIGTGPVGITINPAALQRLLERQRKAASA